MVFLTLQVTPLAGAKLTHLSAVLFHLKEITSFSSGSEWSELPCHEVGTCPNANTLRWLSQTLCS